MTGPLVVDTSFLVKLAFPNPHAEIADEIAGRFHLIAPDFVRVELGNALWKAVEFGGLAPEKAESAFLALNEIYQAVPNADLTNNALKMAIAISHPVYDCMFASLALEANAPLITADSKLIKVLSRERPEIHCLDIMNLPEGFPI